MTPIATAFDRVSDFAKGQARDLRRDRRALADQMAGVTGSPPPAFAAWLEAQGEVS